MLKRIFKFLLKLLALIIFIFIIMSTLGLPLPAVFASVPGLSSLFTWIGSFVSKSQWWQVALAAFGSLAVADPGAASALGEVMVDAVDVLGNVAGGVLGAATSSLWPWIIGGGLVVLWYTSRKERNDGQVAVAN